MANLFCQHKNTGDGAFLVTRNFFKRMRGGQCYFFVKNIKRIFDSQTWWISPKRGLDIYEIPLTPPPLGTRSTKYVTFCVLLMLLVKKVECVFQFVYLCPSFSCCGGIWKVLAQLEGPPQKNFVFNGNFNVKMTKKIKWPKITFRGSKMVPKVSKWAFWGVPTMTLQVPESKF